MATINTDIAQKVDIITRENDSLTITLSMSTSTGSVYDLANKYIVLNIYNDTSDSSLIYYTNRGAEDSALATVFSDASVALYDNFTTDTYTVFGHSNIVVDTVTGVITIHETGFNLDSGSYKYKIIIQSTSSKQTWMYGKFKVNG